MTERTGRIVGPAWHALDAADVVARLSTDADAGLADAEVRARRSRVGPNAVGEHEDRPLWRLVVDQFRSLVVLLLGAAAVVAWALDERAEAIAVLAALGLNALIGFAFEWRARVSLARLRALAVPRALVRRNGEVAHVASADLVPGDVILLEAGAQVPADARVVQAAALGVGEAALTGESGAVSKDPRAVLDAGTPLAERRTMVYLGTTVLGGTGRAVVTATGLATELGRIGQLVALAGERRTPLEREVEALGRWLIVLALSVCGVVGLAGILHGQPLGLMLETAISLAVSAIPEGLPAVTTVALAGGLWRLARAGALVRRLPAVETLGSTTVICADKTGTMTENRMTAVRFALDGRVVSLDGPSQSTTGRFTERGAPIAPAADPCLRHLLEAGVLVNDAELATAGGEFSGDPTETALLVAAAKGGVDPASLRRAWRRRWELPFDPARRMMATLNATPEGGSALFVKGAPGVVLDLSAFRQTAGGPVALTDADRRALLDTNHTLAADGLRVLAIAWRDEAEGEASESESESARSAGRAAAGEPELGGLTFLGLVGLIDPERPGVREAIDACRAAGIDAFMLTGDQRATAEAVGRRLGLPLHAIRSRFSPEEKLHLVEELQARGEIVAMTGDGVNDAPALARADIGIAMGRHGTDVARESADLVLTDDNFATIVKAVEEGRVIYGNLRKVIHFLFSCNLSEILTIFAAIALGFPSPLLPLQILWVNLVTDILPALGLIRDPAEPNVMRRPPRDRREGLVTWRFGRRVLAEAALLAAGVLSAYFWAVWQGWPVQRAGTLAFMAIVLIHPFQAIRCRSERLGWWRLPANRLSWLALVALVGLQWLAVSVPPLAGLLGVVPLRAIDWLVLGVGVLWPIVAMEAVKLWSAPGMVGRTRPN